MLSLYASTCCDGSLIESIYLQLTAPARRCVLYVYVLARIEVERIGNVMHILPRGVLAIARTASNVQPDLLDAMMRDGSAFVLSASRTTFTCFGQNYDRVTGRG